MCYAHAVHTSARARLETHSVIHARKSQTDTDALTDAYMQHALSTAPLCSQDSRREKQRAMGHAGVDAQAGD